ncbi:MAG: methyl-accepting chemotaxis protein [Suilimivivens sp.]
MLKSKNDKEKITDKKRDKQPWKIKKKKPKIPKDKTAKMSKDKQTEAHKDKQTETHKDKQSGIMLFGIRNKIVLCFLIPVLFMIIIGVLSYQKSAEGLSEKFQESTIQTINMAKEYVDVSCTFIESEGLKYAFDADVSKYASGTLVNEPLELKNVMDSIKTDMLASQTANSFIGNIHIITKEGVNMLTTGSTSRNVTTGLFTEYKETVESPTYGIISWIDSHPLLDEAFTLKQDDYILSYEVMTKSNNACVVIDIKKSTIEEFIEGLDLGEGSIVGFVTENGRELIVEQLEEGQESILEEGTSVFYGQDFFSQIDAEHMQGSLEVTFHDEAYLFIYSRSEDTNITICALVPMRVVTSQAEEIKSLTIVLIILACIIALIVGILVVAGIQANMKRISQKLGEVAKGDLTVLVHAKGHDEFQGLARSATNMVINTKKLVNKVTNATGQLEESARGVEDASGVINEYSHEITQAIDEINEGMGRQSEHAQECVVRTDVLSNEIQEVGKVVDKVETLVNETVGMISQGIEIVQLLGKRAQETTEITSEVGDSIGSLKKESEIISTFIETITSISEQTNLLSLNASIEAARAGDAGRGFAVVAEEIRKLADDSAKAAGEIQNNVSHIMSHTTNSVKSADRAQEMVALQAESVEQVVRVFGDMRRQMDYLVEGLKEIVVSMEKADGERNDTVQAVQNISAIIEETAESAEKVKDIAGKLLTNVENLKVTADVLGDNMEGLKSEISVFKI